MGKARKNYYLSIEIHQEGTLFCFPITFERFAGRMTSGAWLAGAVDLGDGNERCFYLRPAALNARIAEGIAHQYLLAMVLPF